MVPLVLRPGRLSQIEQAVVAFAPVAVVENELHWCIRVMLSPDQVVGRVSFTLCRCESVSRSGTVSLFLLRKHFVLVNRCASRVSIVKQSRLQPRASRLPIYFFLGVVWEHNIERKKKRKKKEFCEVDF